MMPSDTVCPRSGWATISASAMTAAGTSGISISRSEARSMPAGGQQMRTPDGKRDFGQLGGLHGEARDDEPLPRAVGQVADAGNEHQHQQDDGDDVTGEGDPPHEPHRHPQRDVARDESDHRPQHLLAEDHPRRTVGVVGPHAGRRQHHDQAERRQQRRRRR